MHIINKIAYHRFIGGPCSGFPITYGAALSDRPILTPRDESGRHVYHRLIVHDRPTGQDVIFYCHESEPVESADALCSMALEIWRQQGSAAHAG